MFDKLFKKKPRHEQTDIERRFNLIARVGQGSMSKVWKATDLKTGRTVAVKVLEKEKTERFEARFRGLNKPHEGEISTSLHHPNIAEATEFGWTTEDEMFLVMDFVEGVSLSLLVDLQNEEMKRFRLRYMIQIGDALSYLHAQNWIHRDICPRNVMISDEKCVKLIDFGLVVPNLPEFRKPGNRTGTAAYMAPELIKRQFTDHRLDIFSYAVTCYEMYTKRFPWDAALTLDAVLQHMNQPPEEITKFVPGIDSQIAQAIMKGLLANPDERWQSAAEMVAVFREAESRLVKLAREAAAKNRALEPPKPAAPQLPPASQPQPAEAESATADKTDSQQREDRKPTKRPAGKVRKRRRPDDDIDLTAMFSED